jgi:hypothetical protein
MYGGMELMAKKSNSFRYVPSNMKQYEDEAVKLGNSGKESRYDSFYEGKTPALVDVHEAYLDRKVSLGEAQDLNPKYNPDKVVGGFKKKGKMYPKTQGAALSSSVQQRKKKKGL